MLEPREELKHIQTYKTASYPEFWEMKLDSNENYIGPSTEVLKALKEIEPETVSHYPCYGALYDTLCTLHRVDKSEIVLTNGADEALSAVLNTYVSKGSNVLSVTPSFSMPKIYTSIIGANYIEIPYKVKWEYPFEEIREALKGDIKALIITSPNNPTGDVVSREHLVELLEKYPETLIIIDETYANYSQITNISLTSEYSNAVVVKSFSKDFALAGLRLGYIVSQKENIENIKKVLSPYNVNSAAVLAAKASLADNGYLKYAVKEITGSRAFLSAQLKESGAVVYKSHANFVLADFGNKSQNVLRILKNNKILVKDFENKPELKQCLRITIPTMSASKRIVSLLQPRDTLVFDMDGVMVDVSNSYFEAIKYTFKHFTGKELADNEIFEARKQGGLNNDWDLTAFLINRNGFNFPYEEIVEVFQKQYWDDGRGSINRENLLISIDLLEELSKNYNLSVFTGRPRDEAVYTLEKYDIKHFFGNVVTMDDLPLNMQKPATLGLSIIKNSFITQNLICFGDTVDDAKCAFDFGAYGIGVLPPNNKSDEYRNLLIERGAKCVIEDINELKNVLEKVKDENC